jgi:hypothetical protein
MSERRTGSNGLASRAGNIEWMNGRMADVARSGDYTLVIGGRTWLTVTQ